MAYNVKGKPFVYKGVKWVDECKTAQDVMIEAGLNWQVAKCELVARMPTLGNNNIDEDNGFIKDLDYFRDCPNAYATYRTDINIPLGIVKERYTPVQNIDAFSFFDDAIGKNKALWQTAGCFGNGERIFVSAKLPNNILVNGDPVENYLVFTNSHDGSSGVKILFTPIRVICENTLNAAIRNATNYISFRHTKSVHDNLDIACELLGISTRMATDIGEKYNWLAKQHISDKEAKQVFANVILTDKEQENIKNTGHTIEQIVNRNWMAIEDSGISMKKVNTISEINNYYYTGVGQAQIVGTKWGAYNAITGYYSNVDNSVGTKRMDSLLYGDKSRKIENAGNLLMAA